MAVAQQRAPGRGGRSRRPVTPETTQEEIELTSVVAAAVAGDTRAWEELVRRFGGLVTAVARSCRLGDADVNDVFQVTWLRLVEHIDRVEQPERVGAWLATTARRESLRVMRASARVTPDHDGLLRFSDPGSVAPDAGPLAEERAAAVQSAFAELPPHCQTLLGILAGSDPPSYKEISRVLSMPIGSIGPTRGRCLEHLRRIMRDQGADV